MSGSAAERSAGRRGSAPLRTTAPICDAIARRPEPLDPEDLRALDGTVRLLRQNPLATLNVLALRLDPRELRALADLLRRRAGDDPVP